MKKRRQFIQLLLIADLLYAAVAACDKTDDPVGDFPSASAVTVKDADGNIYNIVKTGSQVWTVENLKTTKYNDDTVMTNVTSSTQWRDLKTGAYCNYDNLESNAATYGRLYSWYAVNTGKLAPAGWHVPTNDEWTILENYLIANGYNYGGTKYVNKFAKSICAKTNWVLSSDSSTRGAAPENNNSTGFTALPGGTRSGVFRSVATDGYWWSSTEYNVYHAYSRHLHYYSPILYKNFDVKLNGMSVRLVRD